MRSRLAFLLLPLATAFQAPSSPFLSPTATRQQKPSSHTKLQLALPSSTELLSLTDIDTASSSLLLAEESWRQYVPLAVSALVIVDILLGSPAANSILSLGKDKEESEASEAPVVKTKGERVDSGEMANEALEKARNALEWQQYKEDTKREEDKMEDLRKKMDKQMREFDEK